MHPVKERVATGDSECLSTNQISKLTSKGGHYNNSNGMLILAKRDNKKAESDGNSCDWLGRHDRFRGPRKQTLR